MRRLAAPAGILALAGAVRLAWGHGFANYDTVYALVWGREIVHGVTPQYDLALAPTPHPLAEAAGALLSPLGAGAADAMVVLAFLALGAVGWLTYRLGALWFNRAAGVLAALIVLTREPVLSYGSRAYVDLPYLALVLAALVLETRRRRAGAPVLWLLAAAGLLRPEAWLFSAAYLLWLARGQERRDWRALAVPALIAATAPALWLLSDLLITGNPLWSLTGTRDTARVLHRVTGLTNLPVTGARRLGEILREPVLIGAAAGGLLALGWLRARAALGAVAGLLAVGAFALLAAAGLPIITRYMILPAVILAIFCGAAVFGWRELPAGDPRRRRWLLVGGLVAVLLAAFLPSQLSRLSTTRRVLGAQETIEHDLGDLVAAHAPPAACGPVSVPNHRPIPLVALTLDRPPGSILVAATSTPRAGVFIAPATARVSRLFILDPHDPYPVAAGVPAGFRAGPSNRSWRLYERCRER